MGFCMGFCMGMMGEAYQYKLGARRTCESQNINGVHPHIYIPARVEKISRFNKDLHRQVLDKCSKSSSWWCLRYGGRSGIGI